MAHQRQAGDRSLTEEIPEERKPLIFELGKIVNKLIHDVRNPLGAIKGFTSLLENEVQDQPKLKEMAGRIMQATDTLEDLVEKVLQYSRPFKLQLTEVDFILLIKQIQNEIESNLPEGIELKLDIQPETLVFPLDMVRLKNALINLIQNGVESYDETGVVTLSVKEEAGKVLITVEDQGIGIPPEDMNGIFVPFFSTKARRAGFGLPEAKKIIEAHHGEIKVESKPDQGAKFSVVLPLEG